MCIRLWFLQLLVCEWYVYRCYVESLHAFLDMRCWLIFYPNAARETVTRWNELELELDQTNRFDMLVCNIAMRQNNRTHSTIAM